MFRKSNEQSVQVCETVVEARMWEGRAAHLRNTEVGAGNFISTDAGVCIVHLKPNYL